MKFLFCYLCVPQCFLTNFTCQHGLPMPKITNFSFLFVPLAICHRPLPRDLHNDYCLTYAWRQGPTAAAVPGAGLVTLFFEADDSSESTLYSSLSCRDQRPRPANEHFLCFTPGGHHAEKFRAGSKGLGGFNLDSHSSTKHPEDL